MNFFDNVTPDWLERQYLLWQEDPGQLDSKWQAFFSGFSLAEGGLHPPGPHPDRISCVDCSKKQVGVGVLIHRYRDVGHLLACTDPLKPCALSHPLLELNNFGLDESDLDSVFITPDFFLHQATLRDIIAALRETYCRSVGVEYMHMQEPSERQWLRDRMEPSGNRSIVTSEDQLEILHKLTEAALFEEFLHRRFIGQKRFSLEGGEALLVFLEQIVTATATVAVTDMVLGMSHRGRLNVLANIVGKPLANIFAEFADSRELGFVGEGDVKYHQGFDSDRFFPNGSRLHMTLAFNPSHLEAVNPVVEGKCRARQDRMATHGSRAVLPVLIHGDAAFSGQGMVAETLNLSQLEGYSTGGTIHVVLNNQIGFTTLPEDSRSTHYVTDMAKMLMAPVFHVHGDHPEAVVHVAGLALEYRQTFGRDVIIEIICYRRHGHNEGDEPAFTQPLMYDRIKAHPPVHTLYATQLVENGLDAALPAALELEISTRLQGALATPVEPVAVGYKSEWHSIQRAYAPANAATAVPREKLVELAQHLTAIPEQFTPHPKIATLLEKRLQAVKTGTGLDWGNAETLAYAALLTEGIPVRLSGQDCRRGTFNHRHAVLHDIKNGVSYTPLDHVPGATAPFYVYDSMLSENAVLGFEYGYAVTSPKQLVIWEAQFGDFANGAQVIIDQFIASGETKWDRSCGLVMLLPHGYEGQGAEHSSARIERYLQLCAEDNMLVVNPTTPGQLFHLLRRQVSLPFRKPLIVFTPKSLLRHPVCVSNLDELSDGTFREVLTEEPTSGAVSTVLFCSGKIYYDLCDYRTKEQRDDVAIIRVEQLYPLRTDLMKEAIAHYSGVTAWRWVQEEPANMGAWSFLRARLSRLLGAHCVYVGRQPAAAPATGSHRQHKVEQDELMVQAFSTPGSTASSAPTTPYYGDRR
ncbi:MAG: 2-oxoglutarate dehydrogenase E1 component [Desulfuromonadaceae bacterium]|nr:2-oxoglutarate dehydrogenase E1 component [Desulfuromonadaceae bacterium]MDD5107080.1 2-oxoglutarate dehydrogenase E1 component [Desulfuromonadaceae bacterium]